LRAGKPILRNVQPRRAIPQDYQAVGILIWKGMQQKSIDDAEQSGVRANANRK
jgi:hypothetical protein